MLNKTMYPGLRAGLLAAAATFAVFNPWVYNKVVAGHVGMVLAYGEIGRAHV